MKKAVQKWVAFRGLAEWNEDRRWLDKGQRPVPNQTSLTQGGDSSPLPRPVPRGLALGGRCGEGLPLSAVRDYSDQGLSSQESHRENLPDPKTGLPCQVGAGASGCQALGGSPGIQAGWY